MPPQRHRDLYGFLLQRGNRLKKMEIASHILWTFPLSSFCKKNLVTRSFAERRENRRLAKSDFDNFLFLIFFGTDLFDGRVKFVKKIQKKLFKSCKNEIEMVSGEE